MSDMTQIYVRPGRERSVTGDVAPTAAERSAAVTVLLMIWGIDISRAMYLVAELGIADHLAGGPMTAEQLAMATQTHQPSLYRVLRLLAGLGVLTEDESGSFSLTVLGDRLRTDVPASMRSWAMPAEAVGGVRAFEPIVHTVKTGEPGVDAAYGMGLFEFLALHPEHAINFDAARRQQWRPMPLPCCTRPDWPVAGRLSSETSSSPSPTERTPT